jgi:hypothetical protein
MALSRREFVGALAIGPALAPPRRAECGVLDIGDACVLPESRIGILACALCKPQKMHRHECLFYFVPGAGPVTQNLARDLIEYTRTGAYVIFESAAGFGGFQSQREILAEHFGLQIDRPIGLPESRIPYVDYHWPVSVKVRDFDHVVPVRAPAHDVIATIDGIPVAARRGKLIFLGSPIGPALLAGDPEARFWFNALIQRTACPL